VLACVILYRINDGTVEAVMGAIGDLAVFPHIDAALAWLDTAPLGKLYAAGQADYQIVELDEL
jgi:hypothetical protein